MTVVMHETEIKRYAERAGFPLEKLDREGRRYFLENPPAWIFPADHPERIRFNAMRAQAEEMDARLAARLGLTVAELHEKEAFEEAIPGIRWTPRSKTEFVYVEPTPAQDAAGTYHGCEYYWVNFPMWNRCWADERIQHMPKCSHGDSCDYDPCPEWEPELAAVLARECHCTSCDKGAIQALQALQALQGESSHVRGGELGVSLESLKHSSYPLATRIAAMAPWKGSMSDLIQAIGWTGTPKALGNELRDLSGEFAIRRVRVGPTGHRTGPTKRPEWEITRIG